LLDTFKKLKIDTMDLYTDRPFVDEVRRVFQKRQRRAGR
jgi:hypothetical protein